MRVMRNKWVGCGGTVHHEGNEEQVGGLWGDCTSLRVMRNKWVGCGGTVHH